MTEIIFCPSCGARVGEDIPATESLKCPVCGTEFRSYSFAESSESAIVNADRPPEDLSADRSSNPADVPSGAIRKRLSTEDILLARLQSEPPMKKPIPWIGYALLFLVIIIASIAMYSSTSKPDKFAAGHELDSATVQKQVFFGHIIDSLKSDLRSNPSDTDARQFLAEAYYGSGLFEQSAKEFTTYLWLRPGDADARVEYAYALAQANGNLNAALDEIDTALRHKPDNLSALINAGILAAQSISDSNHAATLARSKSYFARAKVLAKKTDPGMAARIDTLLAEIEKTGKKMAKE